MPPARLTTDTDPATIREEAARRMVVMNEENSASIPSLKKRKAQGDGDGEASTAPLSAASAIAHLADNKDDIESIQTIFYDSILGSGEKEGGTLDERDYTHLHQFLTAAGYQGTRRSTNRTGSCTSGWVCTRKIKRWPRAGKRASRRRWTPPSSS